MENPSGSPGVFTHVHSGPFGACRENPRAPSWQARELLALISRTTAGAMPDLEPRRELGHRNGTPDPWNTGPVAQLAQRKTPPHGRTRKTARKGVLVDTLRRAHKVDLG